MPHAVSPTLVARVIGIQTEFAPSRNAGNSILPQHVGVVGQGTDAAALAGYSNEPLRVTTSQRAGEVYGFGSPIHLSVSSLLPDNMAGVGAIPVTVYPMQPDAAGVASVTELTPVIGTIESDQYAVMVSGVRSLSFTALTTDTLASLTAKITASINGIAGMPVIATDGGTEVIMTSKWSGSSSSDINVSIDGPTDRGVIFGVAQTTAGLVNPDVSPALDAVNSVWITMMINTLEMTDDVALDQFEAFAENRWGSLIHRPLVVFTGSTIADPTAASAIADARASSRVLSQLSSPGGLELPLTVASASLVPMVLVANNSPASSYGLQVIDGLESGGILNQWSVTERDLAVKRGVSTVELIDGELHLSDVVTFHHPSGNANPEYRYVRDIVVLQNIIFRISSIFAAEGWFGAPLIPDDQATTNRDARKPLHAKSAVSSVIDDLALAALITNPDETKSQITSQISPINANRLDMVIPISISGTLIIGSIDIDWARTFGA